MSVSKADLRKLKDQATELYSKQKWQKAVELYEQISRLESAEPDWFQRAGECWRRLDNRDAAIEALSRAAEGYARNGFLLKAIAVCKNILQVDSHHTLTQRMLAEFYAKRDGAPPATPAPHQPLPTIHSTSPPPPPTVKRVTERLLGALEPVALDAVAVARPAPLENVELHSLLGGRVSSEYSLFIDPTEGEPEAAPTAFEIELGDEEIELAPMPMPVRAPAPLPSRAAHRESPANQTAELDFSDIMDEIDAGPAAPVAPSKPAPIPPKSSAPVDEMDFSSVMGDEPPPPRALTRIALFSSLPADRFQALVAEVEVREIPGGTRIITEGELGGSLFVVVTGRVRIEVAGTPPVVIAHLADGSFFGELGLLTDFPRSASVVAETDTTVLEMSREVIAHLIADEPEILRVLLRFFRDRMIDRWLSTSPLFSSLSTADARSLAQRFKFVELLPGVPVVTPGKRAEGLFLLMCGTAICKRGNDLVATLRPGQIFGEMSLLANHAATLSVDTETKCWALVLERIHFQEIMLTYPQVLEYVSELAAQREVARFKHT